jgi:aspartate racemase
LVQHLRPDRHVSHSPFFSIGFALQPAPPQTDEVGGLAVAPVVDDDAKALLAELERRRRDVTPATDLLFLQTADTGQQIAAIMHHSSAAFSSATIERMMGHFERLLAAITADPGRPIWDLPLLAADERRLLLDRFSCGDVPIDEHGQDVCLHELVEAQAERTPVAPAIVFAVPQGTADEGDSGETLTYGELNRRANQLAHLLRSLGVGPESRVAVLLDRTPNALVALLGVLKAGGVFVPLDANYPRERMALLYEDAKPSVVVTLEKFAQGVPLDRSRIVCLDVDAPALREQITHNPCGGAHAENAAYVIYTSGSTGRPKGVVVPHRSVVNHNQAAARRFGLVASDRVLQFHSISFDAAIEEIFPTWICGATLVMRGDDLILPGAELHDFIRRYGLTVLDLPTAYWHQWMDSAQHDHDIPPEPLRLVIVGGDQVSPERYAAWRALCGERIRWLNTYGPTETTIISTCDEPAPQPAEENPDWYITVGRPIDHTQAFVLDPRLELAPIGVPGELYLGGRGVARGYHERPGLTADRFVPDPLGGVPGARLYRTGDRARYLPDGRIEFLGRIDQQLKIRGFRVEPGEIVAALRQHPGVREALVVGHGEAGDKRLVAYVAKTAGAQVGPDDLRSFLQGKLPGYMVPAALIVLDDFPLTPGGKIDRRALPDPAGMRSELSHDYVAPQTPTEIELARIWSEVLSVERVGTRDNFFALGGHSLLAARLVARVRGEMGRDLALRTLFERPTIAALAEELARLPPDGDRRDWPAELVTIQPHGSRPPLFVLHAADGNVVNYLPLARHLGEDQPLMGLQHPGLAGEEIGDWSIEQLATRYADVLCAVQPQGPYFLAGWSLGGVLAYELARELTARGEAVGLVALVDAWAWDGAAAERQATANRQAFGAQAGMPLELFLALSPDEQVRFVLDKIQSATEESDEVALIERLANEMAIPIDQAIFLLEEAVPSGQSDRWTAVLDRARERHGTIAPARREQLRRQLGVVRSILDAVGSYRLSTYSGPVTLLKAEQTATGGSSLGWTTLADGGVETVDLPGHHFSLLREPHVRRVAEELTKLLHPTPES